MDILKIKDLGACAEKHDYKYISLVGSNGEVIVAATGKGKTLTNNIETIRKRLNTQPDGTYVIRFQHVQSNKKKQQPNYDYLLVKGPGEAVIPVLPVLSQAPPPLPLAEVRSWNEALSDKQKIAELTAANTQLCIENKNLNAVIDDPDDDEEEDGDDQKNGGLMEKVSGFAEKVLPAIMPALDNYFALKNRALDLKEREIALSEANASRKPSLKSMHPFRPIPQPTDAENWNRYLVWMDGTNDEVFIAEMNYAQINAPEIFAQLLILYPAEEENATA